jgi:succinyl-CoA synthetase beta subunit
MLLKKWLNSLILYNAYVGSDASMFEINPVLKHLTIKF